MKDLKRKVCYQSSPWWRGEYLYYPFDFEYPCECKKDDCYICSVGYEQARKPIKPYLGPAGTWDDEEPFVFEPDIPGFLTLECECKNQGECETCKSIKPLTLHLDF